MTPEFVVPLILGFLTLAGSGGLWAYLSHRKEAPIKKEEADIAAADKTVQMALAVATAAREGQVQLTADLAKERGERQTLSGRVDELSSQVREQNRTISRLREALSTFSNAWDDMSTKWSILRLSDEPPPRPKTKTH